MPPPAAHTLGFRRVTKRQLALLMPGTPLDNPAGVAVTRLSATDDPEDGSDDDEVTLVAVDGGGRLFTNFGLLRAGTWDGVGTALGALSRPSDVAIDRDGRVLVADTGNRRVVLLQHEGSRMTGRSSHAGFGEPMSVAEDGRGGFYVCDRGLNTVFHLDALSGRRSTFGLETGFERPTAVATVPEGETLASGKRRVVVIVDRDGRRMRSFDPAGSLRGTLEAESLSEEEARFDAVDIDYYGNVYAVDRDRHRIHKLREDLYPLDTFGTEGTGVGQFRSPRGIAIHRRLGQVFVTEEDGGQYLWVGTDVREFRGEDRGGSVEFSFLLTEDSTVQLRVLDTQGREIATIVPQRRTACGPQRGVWDGKDSAGRRVAAGNYLAEIRARATYASRSVFERKLLRPFTLGRAAP